MCTFSAGPSPWASPGERPALDTTEELLTQRGDGDVGKEAIPTQPRTVAVREAQRERPSLHKRVSWADAPAPEAPAPEAAVEPNYSGGGGGGAFCILAPKHTYQRSYRNGV